MQQTPSQRSRPYVGRFAPTPSGPLHFGSLVAAMASWLDARAAEGSWLLRIEDLDAPRNVPGAAAAIIKTLAAFGMVSDQRVSRQSERLGHYWSALEELEKQHLLFRCSCSRKEIAEASRANAEFQIYPGTCRNRHLEPSHLAAVRIRVAPGLVCFDDRSVGRCCQQLDVEVGDFVLRRADGIVTYQLAVVVDDRDQQVTHIVRGADLLDSTPRQIYLQRCLGYPTPRYWHVPVVVTALGEKLSKQTGATALDAGDTLVSLRAAARHLGLGLLDATSVDQFWRTAVARFREIQAERVLAQLGPTQ